MKKIVSGKELQDKILESIHDLCGTVKKTLGPVGNNVLINQSTFSPFITNDGVTIAKNIESEDETKNAILEIVKEASIKTNEEVGDGTTTTLVLLESIYEQSLEYINKGISPMVLKKELERTLKVILNKLETLKRKPNKENLKQIATISANDELLGDLAFQVLEHVKEKEAITIKEVPENKTTISYFKGYTCDTTLASPYFLKNTKETFKEAYVLLMNTALTSLESVSFILNDILKTKKSVIIIAPYYEEQIVEEMVSLSMTEDISICLLKIEDYGMHVYEIMKDIACITEATIIENENQIVTNAIGFSKYIEITKENIRIDFKTNKNTKEYVKKLKKETNQMPNDLDEYFYKKRIAMFTKGMAEIKLGAPTKTEGLEKRMRLEDALCALSVCENGILPGSGISLFKIANELEMESEAFKIWQEALKKPLEQILENAGLNDKEIQNKIKKENYNIIYNVSNDSWEETTNTKVIDPLLVVMHSLINATSIASMLITTSSLIINEHINNNDKENEYCKW